MFIPKISNEDIIRYHDTIQTIVYKQTPATINCNENRWQKQTVSIILLYCMSTTKNKIANRCK